MPKAAMKRYEKKGYSKKAAKKKAYPKGMSYGKRK
jgi:hypothetical protein